MVDENNWLDIYKVNLEPKKDKKKIFIILVCALILIILIITLNYQIKSIKQYKEYKNYEAQVISIRKQEEEKKQKEEAEKERIRQEKIPKLTEVGKQNIDNIYKSDQKQAFLTFDDGPSSVTPTILDILKQENIKATFFVLGSRVENMQAMTKRMYEEGHYIANHGYSHVYSSIYASPETVLEEYNKCNNAVKTAIGVPEYNSYLFRFPGGSVGGPYHDIKKQASEVLKQNDILHIDWNALNGDGETNKLSIEYEIERLKQTVSEKNRVIILMHDAPAKKVTAEALPQIISYLRENGYNFKNFYDIIK